MVTYQYVFKSIENEKSSLNRFFQGNDVTAPNAVGKLVLGRVLDHRTSHLVVAVFNASKSFGLRGKSNRMDNVQQPASAGISKSGKE